MPRTLAPQAAPRVLTAMGSSVREPAFRGTGHERLFYPPSPIDAATIVVVPVVATAVVPSAAFAAKAETATGPQLHPLRAQQVRAGNHGAARRAGMDQPAGPRQSDWLTIVQPPHWKGPWHKETTVLWIVTLKGTWSSRRWTARRSSSGQRRLARLGAGLQARRGGAASVIARGMSADPVTLLLVQLENPPTVDQACRFK